MKKFLLWTLALIITLFAAYYQRKTGPTYPKRVNITLNGSVYELKLTRSIGLDERSQIKLNVNDTSIKAVAWYKRFHSEDEYQRVSFNYKVYPVHSFVMNRIFRMTEEKGLFADIPVQPAAGKLQYYIETPIQRELRQFSGRSLLLSVLKAEYQDIFCSLISLLCSSRCSFRQQPDCLPWQKSHLIRNMAHGLWDY